MTFFLKNIDNLNKKTASFKDDTDFNITIKYNYLNYGDQHLIVAQPKGLCVHLRTLNLRLEICQFMCSVTIILEVTLMV